MGAIDLHQNFGKYLGLFLMQPLDFGFHSVYKPRHIVCPHTIVFAWAKYAVKIMIISLSPRSTDGRNEGLSAKIDFQEERSLTILSYKPHPKTLFPTPVSFFVFGSSAPASVLDAGKCLNPILTTHPPLPSLFKRSSCDFKLFL